MMVKPATQGAVIRDPITRIPIPASGGEVPDNLFWRRRLLAGEVVLVEERQASVDTSIPPLTTR